MGLTRSLPPMIAAIALLGTVGASTATAPLQGPVEQVGDVPVQDGIGTERVIGGLNRPWGIAWLPSGDMLITERDGALRHVKDGTLLEEPVAGGPNVAAVGQGGLLDVSLHPDFENNRLVYLTYSTGSDRANRTEVGRGTFDGERLNGFESIVRVEHDKRGGQHFGSRILWLDDGTMLVSIGDGGNPPVSLDGEPIRQQAQHLGTRFGKVLRLHDDGTAPSDNPFVNEDGALDGVYTYGHRNIQGMAIDTETGIIYVNEHGARGGDEINILEPGVNYGWPEVTYSNEYWGPRISPKTTAEGMRDPWTVWTPCIAPCGMVVYRGDEFPELDGSILNGGLVSRQVRIVPIEDDGSPGEQTKIEVNDRVRDVRVGPDGHVYILTDSPQGELRRLVRRGG